MSDVPDRALETLAAAAVDPDRLAERLGPPPHLAVVGTGIRAAGHLTIEAIAHIRRADAVWYLVADPLARRVVERLNPRAVSLEDLYAEGKPRRETYDEMAARILDSVRSGRRTCAVFYGHPGVFVDPAHLAIRLAREEGFRAELLPGISAEDCLFADLGIDPASAGCQSYEALDFLVNHRHVDPTSHLVIWQIGVLGDRSFSVRVRPSSGLAMLAARLAEIYPLQHEVSVYQAAVDVGVSPMVTRLPLDSLERAVLSIVSTLYVPPAEPPRFDLSVYFALSGS
jgi:uncharacterized protein YabN with tetrapyrrole methylase and pyrophosphatase domain